MGCGSSSEDRSHDSGKRSIMVEEKLPTKETADESMKPVYGSLSKQEIKALSSHFEEMAKGVVDDGIIDLQEFCQTLGLPDNTLTRRLYALFDGDNDGKLTKGEFLQSLNILHPMGNLKDKMKMGFRFWDVDGDGLLSKDEVVRLVSESMQAGRMLITPEQFNMLVDATFSMADVDASGQVTMAEWEKLVKANPAMLSNMTLDVSTLLAQSLARL
uniref:EF-hand domain-containing protein n=1 Tax=Eutreptiella gymnastica TaxID=73025 RepID=A0A7S1NME8_9EUGL|mmetsp:Transcript_61463/g.109537  ORF Transcript_61463/g.109537 Transcript_61463/m.109537 type:complete len:215 (+) Transcript_61463:127-771(+)